MTGASARRVWLLWATAIAATTFWASQIFIFAARDVFSQTGFRLDTSLLALTVAAMGIFASFMLTLNKQTWLAQQFGGILLGLTAAGANSLLLWSYQIAGVASASAKLELWPVLTGIALGSFILHLCTKLPSKRATLGAALCMSLAGVTVYFLSSGAPQPSVSSFFPPAVKLLTNAQMLLVTLALLVVCIGLITTGRLLNFYQKEASRRSYQHLALQDALTHLPNRQYVNQIAGPMLRQADNDRMRCAVVLVALDEFKAINDLHGYEVGDAVLCVMANLFRKHLADQTVISRFYGDEFLIINPKMETEEDAIEFARQVRALARRPIQLDSYRLSVRSSIGLSIYPRDGQDLNQLVQRSNLAAKQAKSIGGNVIQPYVNGMEENNRWEAGLAADLRTAALENELSLVFQRQNLTNTGQLVGFEALVRWRHAEKGHIPPEDFIPIAERSGIILDIGNWVLKEACKAAIHWEDPVTLSVNASPLQFSRSDFAGLVSTVLMETGLAAERLEIELTESTPIEDHERVLETITSLRAMGVRVAIDDFGTGYSSLNTLQAFPFDKIKVDRVFTQSLETNSHSRAILRSAILLGHSFGIPVIAEGVETQKQLEFLKEAGCKEVQGFLFGKHLLPSQIRSVEKQLNVKVAQF